MSTATVTRVSGYPVPATGSKMQSAPLRNQISNIVTFLEGANIATGNVNTSEVATLGTANTWTQAQTFNDSVALTFGSGGDAIVQFDGTDLIVDPRAVGAGVARVLNEADVRGDAGAAGILKLTTAETTVVDGDILGRIDFQAPLEASGTDAILVGASIWAEADDTFAADNNATELVFATGASGTAVERMRINSAGWVGIGASADPADPFDIFNTRAGTLVQFRNTHATTPDGLYINFNSANPNNNTQWFMRCDSSTGAKIFAYSDGDFATTTGSYGTISDIKFKDESTIIAARSYWDDFKTLQFKKWKTKEDIAEKGKGAPFRLGLVAQDVAKIFPALAPECSDGDGGTFLSVKSSIIEGPIMARVVQELQTRVEALEAA